MKKNFFKLKRFLKFVAGGGINTSSTYLLYILLDKFIDYQIAYLISYTIGIFFAYWFNSTIVFNVTLSWTKLIFYPIIYCIQLITSTFLLILLVENFNISTIIAPLIVISLMIPLTYLLNKFFLVQLQKTE